MSYADPPERARAPRQRPVAQGQLGLGDVETGAAAPPNAAFFDEHGEPRRLLWCSDAARMGGPCPYTGDRARFMPAGGCCKTLAAAPGRPLDGRVGAEPSDTELAAAGRQSFGGRRTQRVRVLEWFESHEAGGTDHEISVALGIVRPHVAGTRREELVRDGHMIVDSGARRPTDTGSPAIVWKLIRF